MSGAKQGTLDAFVRKDNSKSRAQAGPMRHPGSESVSQHTVTTRQQKSGGARETDGANGSCTASTSSTPKGNLVGTQQKWTGLRFSEVKGDLFSCPDSASLAHCVSEDMHMGKGVATLFKRKFGGVDELKAQGERGYIQEPNSPSHWSDSNPNLRP